MSAELLIATLIRDARADLDGARRSHAGGNGNAIELCERAAEKIVLAVLTAEGMHGGSRHRLDELVARVPDASSIKPMLRAVEHLTADVAARRNMEDVLRRIAEVLEVVAHRFEVELDARDVPARRPRPIR